MRARDDDPDLWGDLYDRFRRPEQPPRRRPRERLGADSRDLLLDAALGVLGSIRTLVEVAEDVLEERRGDRHPPGPQRAAGPRPTRVRPPATGDGFDGGGVRDIPVQRP